MEHCRVFLRLAALSAVALFVLVSAPAHAATELCAPYAVSGGGGANVSNPATGIVYTLDGRGCAAFGDFDAPYFLAQGYMPPVPVVVVTPPPTLLTGSSTMLCAPFPVAGGITFNVVSPVSGIVYTLDGRGCAIFTNADAPYFLTQGYTPPATSAMLCAPPPVASAASSNVTNPGTGSTYTLDGRGCATFAAADAAYFETQGYVPGAGGGPPPPGPCLGVIDLSSGCTFPTGRVVL